MQTNVESTIIAKAHVQRNAAMTVGQLRKVLAAATDDQTVLLIASGDYRLAKGELRNATKVKRCHGQILLVIDCEGY